jgi:hypothetical protein
MAIQPIPTLRQLCKKIQHGYEVEALTMFDPPQTERVQELADRVDEIIELIDNQHYLSAQLAGAQDRIASLTLQLNGTEAP